MKYIKALKYNKYMNLIMGPNPLKLTEELLKDCQIEKGATVMDLGSGQGLTSLFIAKEYGYRVYAADLWSDPNDIQAFFDGEGLDRNKAIPVHADANNLKFDNNFFDGIISTDSYNYFGRDAAYLDNKLLPFIKKGGYIYIAIPGMKKDLHENLPPELLLSWTPEQLDYIHDINYWKNIVCASKNAEIVDISEMKSNKECWDDWLACENEYAVGDRKTMQAGGGQYLNFIKIILKKK